MIHLYGFLIGLGVWLGMEVALSQQKNPTDKKRVEGVLGWAVLGGVIGARAYHVIDFWSRYYSLDPIKAFFVWEGGLGIWGAVAGAMIAIYFYSLIKKENFIWLTDSLVVGVPLAQAIGRLGNWVNGELVGKNGEPLFAYEAFLNLILFAVLWKFSKRKIGRGILTGIYLMGYGLIRIFLEGMRPDEIIWRIGGVPVAVILGVVAIVVGTITITSPVLITRHPLLRKEREG